MPNLVSPYVPKNEGPPPGDGPIHARWYNDGFWTWVAERIVWLDEEAEKQAKRDARRKAAL